MSKNKAKSVKPTPNSPVQVYFKPRYAQQGRSAQQAQPQAQSQQPQTAPAAKGINIDYALNSIMTTVRNNINQNPNKKTVMFNGVQLSNGFEKMGKTYPIPKVVSTNPAKHNVGVRVAPKTNKSTPSRKPSSSSDQRIKELMRQREILADILSGYQKLQRERQVIAVEIQSMRNYLSDIQDKLQKSLSTLRTNRHFNKIGTATTRVGGKNLAVAHKRIPAKKTVNVNTIRNGANSFLYKKKWKA
ncbi:uncharacterized protein LOC119689552 [Teleopsis dalmanni]|uniref:uncharacterized protein LOC119689552 n=1 Tax=Teleopsis dalmanni TaxID=139649 RepID=UPI0018CC8F7F|nr:uncharacterized protein LOC119689552 [Teleopsis dalmanni]